MTVNRGMTLFILLLYCWQEAELYPVRMISVSSTELPPSLRNLSDHVSTVFDEILVQEMLDPNKSTVIETKRLLGKSKKIKKKKGHFKMYDQTDTNKQENKLFSDNEDRHFSNEKEKETIYQIKSLDALEKIIDGLRRALGNNLKRGKKKHKGLFGRARHHKERESLN